MSDKKSKTKKVLPNSEFNTDSEGKPIQSDRVFKSLFHKPKGQSEVKVIKVTAKQAAYLLNRFQLKRESRSRL